MHGLVRHRQLLLSHRKPFNSLFEMLRNAVFTQKSRSRVQLSILYLRCLNRRSFSLRVLSLVRPSFNSLFEMLETRIRGYGDAYVYLSILYLRCIESILPLIKRGCGTFNSLFEMRGRRRQRRRRLEAHRHFQFSI